MNSLIEKYIGKDITVTIGANTPVKISGILKEFDATFLLIETEHTPVLLIPFTSILHISYLPNIRHEKKLNL